jgi:5-methylcytosine-specific restriction endonuclease McrA
LSLTYNDPEYVANRAAVLARDPYCEGYPLGIHGREKVPTTTADHIVAVIDGGTHALDNLRGLCGPCNSRKGVDARPRHWR